MLPPISLPGTVKSLPFDSFSNHVASVQNKLKSSVEPLQVSYTHQEFARLTYAGPAPVYAGLFAPAAPAIATATATAN